jgi:cytochrome c-type biogenesis protein CcmF
MPGSHAALAAASVVGAFAALAVVRALLPGGGGGWGSPALSHRAGGGLRSRDASRRWLGAARVATWVFIALITTALVHLALLLITGDFSVRYVWQHSASYEEASRRLSALLAGSEGSLLVWAVLAAAVAGWTVRRRADDSDGVRRDRAIVHLIVVGVALGVLLLAIVSTPFQSFADAFPSAGEAGPAEGRGLNPVLANPWMPLHTLLTFAAYAVIGLIFAVAVVELLRVSQGRAAEAQAWRLPALQAARWAWLLLSAALLTGVLWAYEEMTFGWFWSWDPVESATLAVWVLLTAALHAGSEGGEGRRALVYGPLMLALTFVGVVFASFVTRSGLHPSVHAFAGGSAGRYLGMGLAVLVAAVVTLAWAARRRVPSTPSPRPWLFWAVWPLLIGAGLIIWGLAYPMAVTHLFGGSVDLDTGFFTTWGYLLAIVLLLVMGFGMQTARAGRRDAVPMLVLFGTLTALAAVVKPVPGLELMSIERRAVIGGWEAFLGSASVLSVLPAAAYALLAVAERWWSRLREVGGGNRLRDTGSAMIHAGVVAAILGATLATVLSSSVTVGVSPATGVGVAEGITVRVVDVDVSRHFDGAGTLVEERETATLEVSAGGRVIAAGTASLGTFPERAMGRHAGVLVSRGPVGDVQAIYHGAADLRPDGIPVTVRRIPLVGLLWLGMVMIIGGMALMTTVRTPGPAGRAASQATAPELADMGSGGRS